MREKIERVEVFGVAVPLVGGGFKNAYVTKTVQKSAVVRITSAAGAIGFPDAFLKTDKARPASEGAVK